MLTATKIVLVGKLSKFRGEKIFDAIQNKFSFGISKEEAVKKILSGTSDLKLHVDSKCLEIDICGNHDETYLYLFDYEFIWKKDFLYKYLPDNIKSCQLLLNASKEFPIKSARVSSEYELIPVNPPLSSTMIEACLYVGSSKNFSRDNALEMLRIMVSRNYHLHSNINQKSIALEARVNALELTLKNQLQDSPHPVYIRNGSYFTELKVVADNFKFTPIKPYKTMLFEGKEYIDAHFYFDIVLNLAEPFGIDELRAKFD